MTALRAYTLSTRNLLTVLLMLSTAGMAFGQRTGRVYPDITAVVNYYFLEFDAPPDRIELRFEKRPTGWQVTQWQNSVELRRTVLWDRQTGRWGKPAREDRIRPGRDQQHLAGSYLGIVTVSHYRFSPYYGYEGWTWDVLADHADAHDLPDSLLYGVARAHTWAAKDVFSNNGKGASGSHRDPSQARIGQFTREELDRYRQVHHHGLELFAELHRRNPEFLTHVGEVGLKLDNEHVDGFLDIWTYFGPEEAGKELPADLYLPIYRAVARNYLASCGPDAILFTNGDNDTYPLLYVQAMENFRRDVLVVNLSLLNLGSYIERLHEGIFGASPLPLDLSQGAWYEPVTEVTIPGTDDAEFDVAGLARLIDERVTDDTWGFDALAIPSRRFRLDGPGADTLAMHWHSEARAFLRNRIACYAMLAANQWQRPVHWAVTVDPRSFFDLEDHFVLEGLTYRLGPVAHTPVGRTFGAVDSERGHALFTSLFDRSIPTELPIGSQSLATNYIFQLTQVANALIAQGEEGMAMEVLDAWWHLFTHPDMSAQRMMLAVIQAYLDIHAAEKASILAMQLARGMLTAPIQQDNWYMTYNDNPDMRHAVLDRLGSMLFEQGLDDTLRALHALEKEQRSVLQR